LCPPTSGTRVVGHNVVMEYFAQDEATRMDPKPNVYETLSSGSPHNMVPAIRNILGGFLFSGDDIYKPVRVLSGGERTRLAVARMLLRPSNTLLVDEPTNHLDLDSKDVLLDALADYGGTLIFVSHDRYFVEKLATKIIEIANGRAVVYPGTYREFLWHKEHAGDELEEKKKEEGKRKKEDVRRQQVEGRSQGAAATATPPAPAISREEQKRAASEAKKRSRADEARRARIEELEARIAETESAIRELETAMSAPGFYDDRAAAQSVIDRHQALMWTVGDLMNQWEMLNAK